MFDFLKKSVSKDSNLDKTPSSQSGGFTPPVTNSSHEDNSLFGGMDVTSNSVGESHDEPSVSGFSFLSSTTEVSPDPVEETSSFSFMNSVNDSQPNIQETVIVHHSEVLDLLSSPVKAVEPPQNLKMAKSSAPKAVKKKKRVSRVGLGREDDDDELDQPTVTHSLPSVAETPHDHDEANHSDGDAERRPSMLEPQSASAFDFLVQSTAQHLAIVPSESEVHHEPEVANRPALLSFSVSESTHNATPAVSSTLSLADFDGMAIHSVEPVVVAVVAPVQQQQHIVATHDIVEVKDSHAQVAKTGEVATALVVDSSPVTTQDKSIMTLNKFHDAITAMFKVHTSNVEETKRIRYLVTSETNNLLALKSHLTSLENEQAKHAMEEDFDKADSMTAPIEQTKIDIEKKVVLLESLKAEAIKLDKLFAQQRGDILQVCSQTVDELNESKNKLIVEAQELESSEIVGNELEDLRMKEEEERINLEKNHIEKEENSLAEEQRVTEEAIRSQSGAIQLKKEDLEINLMSVQSEIKLLEAQLAAKKLEESHLVKELNNVETKINDVRKKYERQLQRIQDRSYTLAETKRECLAEEASLQAEKDAFDMKAKKLVDARVSFIDWTKVVQDDLVAMNLFVIHATEDNYLLGCASAIKSGNEQTDSLHGIQQETLNTLNEIKVSETNLRIEIENLSVEARAIVEQIPKLEADKKAHATSKRFKEAATVAKDIKDQQSRKEEIDARVDALSIELTNVIEQIQRAEDNYKVASKALTDVQKEQDIVRCQQLVEKANSLRSTILKVSTLQSNQYHLTPELNAAVPDVAADVVYYFTSELSVVTEETQLIKELHSLSDSMFVSEISEFEPETEAFIDNMETDKVVVDIGVVVASQSSSDVVNETVDEIVDQVIIDAVTVETDEVGEAPLESVSGCEFTSEQARDLKVRVAALNHDLNIATDNEEYDKAAQLFEDIGALNDQLEKMLAALNMEESDL